MAARQRAAAGRRDVLDQQRRQARLGGLLPEQLQMGDGLRRAPERAAIQVDGLEARPVGRQADRARDAARRSSGRR